MSFEYAGPSATAAITVGVLNEAWDNATLLTNRSNTKIDEALDFIDDTPHVTQPTGVSSLTSPALPTLTLDPSMLDVSLAKIKALDFSGLIDDLTGGFSSFLSTYFPLGDELQAAVDWLERALTTGGTGINETVEAQLWNRDRDRLLRDADRAEGEAMATWAARGFPLPPGALAHQVHQIRRDASAQIAESSRTQAIKSFETEVENVRFAVGKAIELRTLAMSAAGDYVKALALGPQLALELAVAPLDAQAKAYSATADFYKAQLAAYELPLKLGIAKDEIALKTSELNQRADLSAIEERVKAVMASAQMLATQAAAVLNGFHANVGISGREEM